MGLLDGLCLKDAGVQVFEGLKSRSRLLVFVPEDVFMRFFGRGVDQFLLSHRHLLSSIFFQRQTNDSYHFISELMNVFCMAGVHQQPEQSNYLAEGQI